MIGYYFISHRGRDTIRGSNSPVPAGKRGKTAYMNKRWKIIILVLIVILAIAAIVFFNRDASSFSAKYADADLTSDVSGIGREDTYDNYLLAWQGVPSGKEEIALDIASFAGDGEMTKDGLLTRDGDVTSFTFAVPEAGMYQIAVRYLTTDSRGVDIERAVYVNDALPFHGADTLTFTRLWHDSGAVRTDNQGNQIRPSQSEILDWQTAYFRDHMGYITDPYCFYFAPGENTLTLKAVNEPMIIGGITLKPVKEYPTYAEYTAAQEGKKDNAEKQFSLTIEGEDSVVRSDPSLYARYDRSSPSTQPQSLTATVLNYIGGDPWNKAGQWIQWDFEVPADGFYNITLKARQMYERGGMSCRSVYIDGEIPFREVESVPFRYNTSWNMCTLADEAGTPYRFYLTQGKHNIRLEVTMGDMGPILQRVENSIFNLNLIYRKILVLTGATPDRFRDYNIPAVYPEAMQAMDLESKRLYKLVDDTVAVTGQKSDRVAVAQTLANQLEGFVEDQYRLTSSFQNFKDNITSLGTAMQNMSQSKLDVDCILITGAGAPIPKNHENFFTRAWHEIKSCVASYFVDYNTLGDKYEGDNAEEDLIEVWIVAGRDQSTVLKTMIDDTFTPASGIHVNVKLVAADAILTAVVAGNGPDVVMSVSGWFAVNYAMRNAVEDLTQFADFGEVIKPFHSSILTPLTYKRYDSKGDYTTGVYGLPETQNFNLLFYREDVLEELGLKVPETWKDIIDMLPTIQGNSLTVGVPFPEITLSDISVFNSLVYQNGGAIYDDEAKKTLIDSEAGVSAFKLYTSLYNDYGLPVIFDFVSRFRSGEMPLGVASYATYNTLMVSAPEIKGLWNFAPFPGTVQADGTIDNTVHTDGLCSMMIKTDSEKVRSNAWEFMKWWVSTDSQVRFGREMESVLGASARYQTANTEALRQLAWSHDQLAVLDGQMGKTRGFPEIAGGYSTTRHITNAIRKVINEKVDTREALLTYTRTINEEIKTKRREFNMPVD